LGRQVGEQARRVRAQRVQARGQPRRRWLADALSLRVPGGAARCSGTCVTSPLVKCCSWMSCESKAFLTFFASAAE